MIRADRKQPLVPSFEIELHGTVLGKDTAGWIVNVTVEDELDVPGMFAFELASREDERGTRALDRRHALPARDDRAGAASATAASPTHC